MANREFLMLAHDLDTTKHSIGGWFMSIKLDGMRAYWDGGITRGMPTTLIPWANIEKDGRYVKEPIATGLWSRYGKVIVAPTEWLDKLPKCPLDGELYAGRGKFQFVMSTVKQLEPVSADWSQIHYMAFDRPAYENVFQEGRINNPNFKKTFSEEMLNFAIFNMNGGIRPTPCRMFMDVYKLMCDMEQNDTFHVHAQIRLPLNHDDAVKVLENALEAESLAGGEGLMIRKPEAMWEPRRLWTLLKLKKLQYGQATVLGYTTGRQTDKGSKLLGVMGALKVTWYNKETDQNYEFEIGGFNDYERALSGDTNESPYTAYRWATENPGKDCPDWITNTNFWRGSKVKFKYRELTDDGIPKEARYNR